MTMAIEKNEAELIFPMDEAEARTITSEIRGHLREYRDKVLLVYRREGWKALGYESFQAWAQGEFEVSWQQVYNIKAAAEFDEELQLHSPTGEIYQIPVKHATHLRKLGTAEERVQAYQRAEQQAKAQGKDSPTETIVAQAVQTVQQETIVMGSPYPVVRQMLANGELSTIQAKKITDSLNDLADEPAQAYVQSLMARFEMTDPELIYPLGHKHKNERQRGKDSYVLDEIERTGSLAGKHLSKANIGDLKRANQEAQHQHIAEEAERQRQIALLAGEPLPEEFALTLWKNAPVKSAKRLIKELPEKDLEAVFSLLAQHLGYVESETGAVLLEDASIGVQTRLYKTGTFETIEDNQPLQLWIRVKPEEEKEDDENGENRNA